MRRLFCAAFVLTVSFIHAQNRQSAADTVNGRDLDSIIVSSSMRLNHTPYLKAVEGMNVYAGKKTNSVILDPAKANLAANVSRQLFSQIPGLTLWDMSGSGTQINLGTRGTDAHRSIEMNMRQNGYNINSDVFGYPEAHYTPPMQGVQKVELVRGSAALQFGPQFGGMLNYQMKEGDSTKPFSLETEQTAGSFNFFNSFTSIGGRSGKWSYYAYYDKRHGDGWRKNAAFSYHAYYVNVRYAFSNKSSLALQFSRMDYREQIAGGLTDEQFHQDPRASGRSRNFFSPFINIPALLFHHQFSTATKLQVTSHYLGGERNSVQFLNPPNIPDTVNTQLGTYNPRQVDRDYYSGFTTEARLLHQYRLKGLSNTLSTGVRFFDQTTKRRQKGVGTTGSDFDLSLVKPYGTDLRLHSTNYAAFAENIFQLTKVFSITPGVRYEMIDTKMEGVINNASVPVSYKSNRSFPLFGTGLQYSLTKATELYGNASQAYRPFLYANVTPADRIDVVDPNLKDSKGYDIDLGYRGQVKDILKFDVNGFYLFYGNRVGQLTLKGQNDKTYLYTTNIGDAVSKGVEAYISFSFARLILPEYSASRLYRLRLFNALSYTHARYLNGSINKGGINTPLKGNWVEGTPEWTNRTGLAWQQKTFVTQLTFTYVGKSYSDANNTVFNPNGATGIVPAYHLWDLSVNWRFLKNYSLSGGINNIANAKYFTRRINMYPGPGILPGDGRSFYVSLGLKL
ncbi:TonB-dependent receptor family protein [Flavisolibacter nicotianae]|uniref:TonB-dependent receptor family protein n=1 Tax=Flavisolibacter nicotianae TaxID=2364882 RepID=UPI000EB097AE|nr:TonB-dependent receptor [Flavisolibacter nicotianae]